MYDIIQYSPTIIYKKGTEIPIVDALSRDCNHEIKNQEMEEELDVQIVLSMTDLAKKQHTWAQLGRISRAKCEPSQVRVVHTALI